MAITIKRNATGNCVQFSGSTNPTYFNACLTASVNPDDANKVDIINDARSEEAGKDFYEFFAIDYTDLLDEFGQPFADAATAVTYINTQARVLENMNTLWFDAEKTVDFSLDPLGNTILVDNGDAFAVNSITAVLCFRGQISIVSARGTKVFYTNVYAENVTINGEHVSSNIPEAIARLNSLFTRTTGGTPNPIAVNDLQDPADTNLNYMNGAAATVNGDGIDFSNSTSLYSGAYTSDVIASTGEKFVINELNSSGELFVGLTSKTTPEIEALLADADFDNFGTVVDFGVKFSSTRKVLQSYVNSTFGEFDAMPNAIIGATSIQIGIRSDGKGYIANDLGVNALRLWDTLPAAEYKLVIISNGTSAEVGDTPTSVQIVPESVPNTPYVIESPDGVFNYPLFRTVEEANYISEINGGASTSSTRTFVDEPTGTTWYSPTTGYSNAVSTAPAAELGYLTIATEDDGNYIPFAQDAIVEVIEGEAINYQVPVTGEVSATDVSGLPSGVTINLTNYTILGTAPVAGEYDVVITLANAFGSRVVTITLDVQAPTPTFVSTRCLNLTSSYGNAAINSLGNEDHPLAHAGDSFTFNFWIKAPSTPNSTKFLTRAYSSKNTGMDLQISSMGILAFNHERGGRMSADVDLSSFFDDQWHMVTVVWNSPSSDGSSLGFFTGAANNWITQNFSVHVDAVALPIRYGYSSGTFEVTPSSSTSWGKKGSLMFFNLADGFGYSPTNMKVDDIAVYSDGLSQAEVTAAYGTGTPVDMNTVNGSELYWYWRMGDNTNSLYPTIVDTQGHESLVLQNMSANNIVTR